MVIISTMAIFTLLLCITSAIDYTNKICLNDQWASPSSTYSFDHWDVNDKPVYRAYMPYLEAYDQIDFNTDNYDRTSNQWGVTSRAWQYALFTNPFEDEATFTETLIFWCTDNSQPDKFLDCNDMMFREYNGAEPVPIADTTDQKYFSDCGDQQFNTDDILVNIVIKQCDWAYRNHWFSKSGEEERYHITNTNTCSNAAKTACDGQEQCEFLVTSSNSPECVGNSREELNGYTWTCQLDN